MIFLHIGLPKTYTTTLQFHVFKKIAKQLKINYFFFGQDEKLDSFKLYKFFHNFAISSKNKKHRFNQINYKKKIIISYENLSISNYKNLPKNIHESAKILKKNFNSEVKIIITIREPFKYFNSLYNQLYNVGKIINKDYFIKDYSKFKNFSYRKLISYYTSFYKEVIIFKVDSKNFTKNLFKYFNISKFDKNILSYKHEKKSLSNFSMKVLIFLDKFFRFFKFDLYIYIKFIRNKLNTRNKTLSRWLDPIRILKKIDKFLKLENSSQITKNDFNFSKLNDEYKNLPDILILKK